MSTPTTFRTDATTRQYLVNLKHRLEAERHLLAETSKGDLLMLHRRERDIVVARANRETAQDCLQSLNVPQEIIALALSACDEAQRIDGKDGLRHTPLFVVDDGEAFAGIATWDAGQKIAMTVFSDDVVVLDEQL